MKKQLFSFLLLLLLFTNLSAQNDSKPGKEQERLRTDVTYLASDKLEGRKTGETGATFAAGYVSNIFAQLKLKTAGNAVSRSYMQKFPFVTGVQLGQSNVLKINNSTHNLQTDWMPAGFSANGKLSNAAVVFAGYGIVSTELKYDDFAGLDVKDKVLLVFAGTPEKGNPRSPFVRFADARVKAKIASDKGAKGLIVISGEQNFADDKLTKLEYDQVAGETTIPTIIISRSAGAKLLGEKDAKSLDETEKWFGMQKDTPQNIQIKLVNTPNMTAELDVNLTKTTAEGYNVVGILEGRDSQLKNEAIVIGAHYDHLGRGGKNSLDVNSKEIHHGADDNASGVAAMLELARQFSKGKNNKRTLIFIAFGGEEEGLLGSKAYTNNPVFPLDKTVAMINMDMVGRLNENKLTVGGIGTASEWKNLVENLNAKITLSGDKEVTEKIAQGLKDKNISNVEIKGDDKAVTIIGTISKDGAKTNSNSFALQLSQDGFGPSDHSSFYSKQIPVLFFFTGTHSDYHKPSDTSNKINYQGLEKVMNYVGEIVTAIDQNPTRPTYTTAPSSGMMGGRSGGSFNVSLGTVPGYADNTNDGLSLDGVRDGSPAAKAGIKAGDKIIKIAGRDIKNISDYVFVLGEMKAGEEYEIVIMRGTEKLTLKITPEARK
jgi:Zn-dependent M28 family amino/carboxypeptidase